ncbi:hypothetical protein [Aurantiacibacter marinus]|uniref:Uncharacterized protein n=1 Tax=Aurantiacibacter marinus TaxID=874156 RepID=A0A0H0XPL9_9SPHN|nr:hypothetical protein [Aurantiacibacter marinus]KLI64558.1 hypothetical protein AAV99_03005 [Aurantiacibacter marinus]
MKLILAAVATTLLAATVPAAAQDREAQREAQYEEAFEELVEGRVAGEPTSCISTFNSNRLRVVENVGLAYERGGTLWVARASDPRNLGPWDVPIIERTGSQLCRHDVHRTIDRSSGMFSGILFLSDWTPYTEAPEAEG